MKNLRLLLLVLPAMFFFSKASAEPLKAGDNAPVVTGVTHTGEKLNLGDVYAKGYTLVYFYPKADTPGCTAQGCSLRDAYADLGKKGVTIIGVSTDGVEAQQKFREKYNLPFTLIADSDKTVVTAFGVPTTMGFASRQAFLINKAGKIVWADYKASTKKQAEDVLAALKTLGE
jgi:peroxiredoxin Q/BCP